MELTLLQDIIVVLLVSIPLVLLCTKLKISPLIGFMITGIIIGPHGLKLIQNPTHIQLLAEIGVVLLLFAVGLEFSLAQMARLRRVVFLGGSLQVFITLLIGFGIGLFLNWSPNQSLYFGAAISLSSTAVVLASLSQEKALDSTVGQVSTGILIYQDFIVIPFLAFLPLIMGSLSPNHEGLLNPILMAIGKIALVLVVSFFLHRWILTPLWRAVVKSKSRELFIVTILCLAMGMSWFTDFLGLSYALGAFLGGLLVSTTEYRYYTLSEVLPFRHGFSALFFASIGMLFSVYFFLEHIGLVMALIMSIPLIKVLVTTLSVRVLRYSVGTAIATGFMLGQIGEFSFLLVLQGNKLGVFSDFFYHLIVTFTVITLLVTPLVASLSLKGPDWINFLLRKRRRILKPERSQIRGVLSRGDHVILCGFGPLGQTIGSLLQQENIPYRIIEMNPETYHRLSKKDLPIQLGDGASETILLRAGIEKAKVLAIAIPDYLNTASMIQRARELNKDLFIVARSRYRPQSEALYTAGADVVVCEELEGGIEMGRYLLKYLGRTDEDLNKLIEKIRSFGSADFF